LASSFAYYAALGVAPLLFIVFSMASFFGEIAKVGFFQQLSMVTPEISKTVNEILRQSQFQAYLGAESGITGALFLIFLSSLIFNQLKNSFDIIMDNHPSHEVFSLLKVIKKRGWIILIALMMCLLFTVSLFIAPIIKFLFLVFDYPLILNPLLEIFIHLTFLTTLFTGLFKLTPTKPAPLNSCLMMGGFSSLGFLIGNYLTGLYMRQVAFSSLYGAAGAILVFLLWAFYSALTIFLVLEAFTFFRNQKMRGGDPSFF
jgi:membrane protein